jgi:hypothetical protein
MALGESKYDPPAAEVEREARKLAALSAWSTLRLEWEIMDDESRAGYRNVARAVLRERHERETPLVEALQAIFDGVSFSPAVTAYNALLDINARDAAPEPTPRYRSRDMGGWWVVEDTTKPMSNGVLPVVCMVMQPASEQQANAVRDALNARQRAAEGK